MPCTEIAYLLIKLEHNHLFKLPAKGNKQMFTAENQVGIMIKPMFALSFCFHSKDSKRFSSVRLTDAVIQLEREIMQQKEKLSSSSTELRIMIRWCIILVSLPLTVGIQ